jgi:ribosome biogenesis GTPase A
MAKAKKLIRANLSLVDAVIELVDARIPLASRNSELDSIITKPKLILLNKADIADDTKTQLWLKYHKNSLAVNSQSGKSFNAFYKAVRTLLSELISKSQNKGQVGRPIRLMFIGIPNVGKSTLINHLVGRKQAKVEDRPGVTRTAQWLKIKAENIELLDMPGILSPKFDDQEVALRLAQTGAIRDTILDTEFLAMRLLEFLQENYRENLLTRYKLPPESESISLETIGKKRGYLVSGGEVDTERTAIMLLDEFRACKLGRITLETPPE